MVDLRKFVVLAFVAVSLVSASSNNITYADESNTGKDSHAVYRLGSVCIKSPWAFDSLGKKVGAVFMLITARKNFADQLLSAATPQASRVEIHDIVTQNGVMMMEQAQARVLKFDSDTPLEFRPHGLHVMLMGLQNPLTPDSDLQLTLEFEKSGAIELEVNVRELTTTSVLYPSVCD